MKCLVSFLTLALFLAFTTSTFADHYRVVFSGKLSDIREKEAAPDLEIGDEYVGVIYYDSTAENISSNPDFGSYSSSSSSNSITVWVGGQRFRSGTVNIRLTNNIDFFGGGLDTTEDHIIFHGPWGRLTLIQTVVFPGIPTLLDNVSLPVPTFNIGITQSRHFGFEDLGVEFDSFARDVQWIDMRRAPHRRF